MRNGARVGKHIRVEAGVIECWLCGQWSGGYNTRTQFLQAAAMRVGHGDMFWGRGGARYAAAYRRNAILQSTRVSQTITWLPTCARIGRLTFTASCTWRIELHLSVFLFFPLALGPLGGRLLDLGLVLFGLHWATSFLHRTRG